MATEIQHENPQTVHGLLLGPPLVYVDGETVALERRKAVALLAYLLVSRGAQRRDQLATLLWQDADSASARANLRRVLADLTPVIRPWLHVSADTIELQPDNQLTVDVQRFQELVGCTQHANTHPISAEYRDQLAAAVALYRGDFLDGFAPPDSAAFEEWQFFQAEELRRALAGALDLLSRPDVVADSIAINYARRWLALDPLHEEPNRRLMQLYARSGQQSAAIRQYRALSDMLGRELNLAPSAETTALYEQIRLGDRAAQSRRAAAPLPVTVAPTPPDAALATPATPFFGRLGELAWIAAAIADPNCRMVTIVGPGGMGKTRLALQAAEMNRAAFPDGVHHISLVGVTTSERLLTAITDGLGIAVQGEPETYLASYFRAQRALLVLDNIEQALAGAEALARMLRETQQLKLLVTSRERLNIQDEWVLDIDGLEVPDDADIPDAASYSAVELFVQRARRVRSDFQLDKEDLAAIIEICQLVDGMPLAIELAAAWVRVLSCREIAAELEQSMGLLTTTLRDVPERHRSIEGVFTQAWERLAPEERQTLRRLSVFEDGTPRAAASQVVGASPVALAALADRALIRRDSGGRYIMHELLRQFASRKLANHADEQQATWQKYCDYYMALLERRGGELEGPHQRAALQELGAEFDNIQGAWTYAIEQHLYDELARGLDGLYRFCDLRGWYQDGIAMFRQLTSHSATTLSDTFALLLARAQARQGALLCWVGQYDEAQALLEQALVILRERDHAQDVAATINWMGMVAYQRGDSEAAQRLLSEGLQANVQLQLHNGVAWSLDMLGDLASDQGNYEQARELLNDSIMRFTALGDQASAAWSLSGLGRVLMLSGEREEARQLLEENLALFRSLSDPHGLAITLANLGELALESGDTTAARGYYLDALHQARLVYAIPLVLDILAGYTTVLSRENKHEQALALAVIVLENPASWRESTAWAEQARDAAHAALPAPALTAELRAHSHTWEDVSETILATKSNT